MNKYRVLVTHFQGSVSESNDAWQEYRRRLETHCLDRDMNRDYVKNTLDLLEDHCVAERHKGNTTNGVTFAVCPKANIIEYSVCDQRDQFNRKIGRPQALCNLWKVLSTVNKYARSKVVYYEGHLYIFSQEEQKMAEEFGTIVLGKMTTEEVKILNRPDIRQVLRTWLPVEEPKVVLRLSLQKKNGQVLDTATI